MWSIEWNYLYFWQKNIFQFHIEGNLIFLFDTNFLLFESLCLAFWTQARRFFKIHALADEKPKIRSAQYENSKATAVWFEFDCGICLATQKIRFTGKLFFIGEIFPHIMSRSYAKISNICEVTKRREHKQQTIRNEKNI